MRVSKRSKMHGSHGIGHFPNPNPKKSGNLRCHCCIAGCYPVPVRPNMTELPPIVIVDDDGDDVFFLSRRLKEAGIENPVISFGAAELVTSFLVGVSLEQGGVRMPCALFTDLRLGGTNGLELVRWVKSRDGLRDLKVFVMSGSEHPEHRRQAAALGADGFVLKFPSTRELRAMLAPENQTLLFPRAV